MLTTISATSWVTLTRPCPSSHLANSVHCSASRGDPHDVVGVPRGATLEEIRRAYRKRARELHPDLNDAPDATDSFRELVQAFKELVDGTHAASSSSNAKRSAAQRARQAWQEAASSSSPPSPAGSRRESEELEKAAPWWCWMSQGFQGL